MFWGTILTPSHSMRHPPECLWLLESTYTEKAQKKVLVWTDVNEASRIKCFESSGKVEKHCTRTRPFYFLHIVAGSELDVFFWGVYTLWRTHHKEFKQNEFYFGIGPQTWTFQQIMFHWNQTDKKKTHFFCWWWCHWKPTPFVQQLKLFYLENPISFHDFFQNASSKSHQG